jgi:hypothetical protein
MMENIRTPQEWDKVCSLLETARTAAYSIPESVYRRDNPEQQSQPQESHAVILEPEERALFDIIQQTREGKISESEGKATLAKMLFPGEDDV